MTFTSLMAQSTVADLDRAIEWYSLLFDRSPDSRPMDGLVEWHLDSPADGAPNGLQVWLEPERAGRCSTVIATDDLDGCVARLADVGLGDVAVQQASASRLVALVDPDGNRVAIVGS